MSTISLGEGQPDKKYKGPNGQMRGNPGHFGWPRTPGSGGQEKTEAEFDTMFTERTMFTRVQLGGAFLSRESAPYDPLLVAGRQVVRHMTTLGNAVRKD